MKTAKRFRVRLKDLHGSNAQHRGSCKNGHKVSEVGLKLVPESTTEKIKRKPAVTCTIFARKMAMLRTSTKNHSTDGNLPSTVYHIEEVKLGDRVLFVLEEMNHSRSHSDHEVVFVDQ